jgi:hypothetical protein
MRQRLGEMLIEAGAIDQAQLKSALADQRRWGRPLGRTLVEMRLIREEDLVRVLAKQLGMQSVDLDQMNISDRVIELVPAHIARQHNVVPFAQPMKFLDVAMLDPTNLGVVDEIRIRTQLNVRPFLAGPKMIERNIERYYGASTRLSAEIEIPIMADVTVKKDRDEVSLASVEVRDGLRTYQHRTGPSPTAPPPPLSDDLRPSGRIGPPPLAQPGLPVASRDREIDALQSRISMLEAIVQRDEAVLRKLLSLLIEKGIATREEIIERLG